MAALREVYKKKKYLPLDLHPKKIRAICRRLTKHQSSGYSSHNLIVEKLSVRSSNSDPCIYYAISLPTELRSRE
ncbi:60S ribosomal L35-like protein, putative [Medicago truncatula]|uniref:60S ribosomal L35-like protein, putative n=1 Tax=Medicago truncatula TaxID=3880 RepID=G7JZ36_MEDTR|nr:60S ribosomal L35-like protein, putative [Medicago truncatula]